MAGPGKKRYQVTLTEATAKEFMQIAEEMGMPPGIMSSVLDDALRNILSTMQKLKVKGKTATFGDFLQIVGEQLNEMEKEVPNDQKAAKGGKGKKG